MYEHTENGFRWDTGPSVITMRHVFEELFASVGKNLHDYITLMPVEPLTRYFYPDGTIFNASRDWSTMANEIASINERDVEGFLKYLAYAAQIHRITGKVFIYDQPPTPASFAKVPVQDWLKADPFRTMHGAIKSFVKSDKIRQLLGRFATYVGGSPYLAPATLNVIAHVELTGGVWYPQGGIYTIASALETLATELGVTIKTNCSVKQINVTQHSVSGVTLDDGEIYNADVVVSNVDVTTTAKHLLPAEALPTKQQQALTSFDPSCSGFVMMLGIEGHHPNLAHHNIFFSSDYKQEFQQIFGDNVMPDDPTIYLCITSKTDPQHAPDNHENWFILVNAPAISDQFDWQTQQQQYRDKLLHILAERYNLDIRDKIKAEKHLTPADLQQMSGGWRGALYGPSPNDRFSAFKRPHNRSKHINGLYYVGGTTHPGGGIPMVMLSGKVTASLIQDDTP
jgi:phytoene desaturase